MVNDSLLYGMEEFSFQPLTQNVKEQIENWGVYNDFYNEASTLNGLKLEQLRLKVDKLLSHTDSLTKKIPDTLFTNAIYSRLIVVKTRVKLLKQEASRAEVDKPMVENYISETNRAVDNLIVQLNEKFLKDNIEYQQKENEKQELEKQKRFLDSVYQAELRDQEVN